MHDQEFGRAAECFLRIHWDSSPARAEVDKGKHRGVMQLQPKNGQDKFSEIVQVSFPGTIGCSALSLFNHSGTGNPCITGDDHETLLTACIAISAGRRWESRHCSRE